MDITVLFLFKWSEVSPWNDNLNKYQNSLCEKCAPWILKLDCNPFEALQANNSAWLLTGMDSSHTKGNDHSWCAVTRWMHTQQRNMSQRDSKDDMWWEIVPFNDSHQQMSVQRSVGKVYLCKQPQMTQLIAMSDRKALGSTKSCSATWPLSSREVASSWKGSHACVPRAMSWVKSSFPTLPITSPFLSKQERKRFNSPFVLSILFLYFILGATRKAPPQQWEVCLLWDRCLGKYYFW